MVVTACACSGGAERGYPNHSSDYLGRDKTEKKESVIGEIKRFKAEEKAKPTEKKEASKEAER